MTTQPFALRTICQVSYLMYGPAYQPAVTTPSVIVDIENGQYVVVPLRQSRTPYYCPEPSHFGQFKLYEPQMADGVFAHRHGDLIEVTYRLATLDGYDSGFDIKMHSVVIDNFQGDFYVFPDRIAPHGYEYMHSVIPGYYLF